MSDVMREGIGFVAGTTSGEVAKTAENLLKAAAKPTPIDAAHEILKADQEHRSLAADQIIMLTMERRHFQPSWNALSEGLFKWFRHQGFWPANWTPSNGDGAAAVHAYAGDLRLGDYIKLKKAEKIALIHSEVSEMLEAVRKEDYINEAEELADVLVRLLDYAGGFQIDVGQAFYDKMVENYKRPRKHGKGF